MFRQKQTKFPTLRPLPGATAKSLPHKGNTDPASATQDLRMSIQFSVLSAVTFCFPVHTQRSMVLRSAACILPCNKTVANTYIASNRYCVQPPSVKAADGKNKLQCNWRYYWAASFPCRVVPLQCAFSEANRVNGFDLFGYGCAKKSGRVRRSGSTLRCGFKADIQLSYAILKGLHQCLVNICCKFLGNT